MKNIFKVTILFCLIISYFVVTSFATKLTNYDFQYLPISDDPITDGFVICKSPYLYKATCENGSVVVFARATSMSNISGSNIYFVSDVQADIFYYNYGSGITEQYTSTYHSASGLYYYTGNRINPEYYGEIPVYTGFDEGMAAAADFIENNPPQPIYSKNANVDEFIANTMISMGVKFDTPVYALSYASDAWDWCIDETNIESANLFDEWNIESFVSYCNAQSNNYLNWYNGYKVSKDVTNALGEYIRQNIRSLTGLPAGVTSLTGAYLPIYHYGSGFQSGASSPTAQTFYPAQTITYFNGEYVNETDDISTSQFLYTPADVRRFLGYPGSSPVITPSTPTGTGTITDDPNNPDQKNISINFPSLDWLADAIKSILDFLRDAFTTLANLITQLLDAILGLFSDAFESLQDFGQGIIEFIQSVFSGLSDLLSGYVPSDISVIIVTFIALNFGIGLITFVLKGH